MRLDAPGEQLPVSSFVSDPLIRPTIVLTLIEPGSSCLLNWLGGTFCLEMVILKGNYWRWSGKTSRCGAVGWQQSDGVSRRTMKAGFAGMEKGSMFGEANQRSWREATLTLLERRLVFLFS